MNENTKLKEKLDELFLQDPHLADYPIEVLDNNGVVTLTGDVATRELSEAAEKIARQTNGVITVINDLAINKDAVKTTKPQRPTIIAR
jgi:osmotically-inducible protein OsmY